MCVPQGKKSTHGTTPSLPPIPQLLTCGHGILSSVPSRPQPMSNKDANKVLSRLSQNFFIATSTIKLDPRSAFVTVVGKGTDHQRVSIVSKEAILTSRKQAGLALGMFFKLPMLPFYLDLSRVGQHLIDQLTVPSGSDFSKTPIFNSFVNDSVAYIKNRLLFVVDASCAAFRS